MKSNLFRTLLAGILVFSLGVPSVATAKNAPVKSQDSKYTVMDLENLLNKSFESFNTHKTQENLFSDLKNGGLEISSLGQKFLWNDLKSPAPKVKVEEGKLTYFIADGKTVKTVEIKVQGTGEDSVLMINDKKFAGNDLKSMKNLRAAMVKAFVVNAEQSSFNFLNFILPMAHASDNPNKENWFTNNLGWILMGAGAVVGIWTKSWQWGLGLAGAGGLWMLARTAQDNYPGSKPTGGYKSDDLPTEH